MTPEDRALIDAAIAAGRVTRFPYMAVREAECFWDGKQLLTRNGGMRGQVRREYESYNRARRLSHATRPDVVAKRECLARLVAMRAEGKTVEQMAEAEGLTARRVHRYFREMRANEAAQ
jgi:hypothetical protein